MVSGFDPSQPPQQAKVVGAAIQYTCRDTGDHLILSSSFSDEQEGKVTAVVAKARYQKATENQTKQRFKHSARSRPSNTVIKVLVKTVDQMVT